VRESVTAPGVSIPGSGGRGWRSSFLFDPPEDSWLPPGAFDGDIGVWRVVAALGDATAAVIAHARELMLTPIGRRVSRTTFLQVVYTAAESDPAFQLDFALNDLASQQNEGLLQRAAWLKPFHLCVFARAVHPSLRIIAAAHPATPDEYRLELFGGDDEEAAYRAVTAGSAALFADLDLLSEDRRMVFERLLHYRDLSDDEARRVLEARPWAARRIAMHPLSDDIVVPIVEAAIAAGDWAFLQRAGQYHPSHRVQFLAAGQHPTRIAVAGNRTASPQVLELLAEWSRGKNGPQAEAVRTRLRNNPGTPPALLDVLKGLRDG
jgi:hypothetical protein